MSRWSLLMVAITAVLGVAGCGENRGPTPSASSASTSPPAISETTGSGATYVDGIPRASTRIDFTNSPKFPKAEALAWLNQNYPVGKKVTVYYDPDDPDLAVLVPGAKDSIFDGWTAVVTAASCWLVSWVFLILERKRRASEGPR